MVSHVHCVRHPIMHDTSGLNYCSNVIGGFNAPLIPATKKCLYCQKSFCDECVNLLVNDCSPEKCERTDEWLSDKPWNGCTDLLLFNVKDLKNCL